MSTLLDAPKVTAARVVVASLHDGADRAFEAARYAESTHFKIPRLVRRAKTLAAALRTLAKHAQKEADHLTKRHHL